MGERRALSRYWEACSLGLKTSRSNGFNSLFFPLVVATLSGVFPLRVFTLELSVLQSNFSGWQRGVIIKKIDLCGTLSH